MEKNLLSGELDRRWQEERYTKRFGEREERPPTEKGKKIRITKERKTEEMHGQKCKRPRNIN